MRPSRSLVVAAALTSILLAAPATASAVEDRFVHVIDATGSTGSAGGTCGTILECEIDGAIALHDALLPHSPLDAGLITLNDAAVAVDFSPSAGEQNFTDVAADDDGNGTNNIEQALGGVGAATGDLTYNDALTELDTLSGAGWRLVAALFSDGAGGGSGLSTGPDSPLQDNKDAGTVINTFVFGGGSCGAGEDMRTIAEETGGSCTEVSDPSQLSSFPFTPTDTDGDGVHDGADACPSVSGTGSDGCAPPPVTSTPGGTTDANDAPPATSDATAPAPLAPTAPVVLVDRSAPQTSLGRLRVNRRRRTATIVFSSSEPGSTFQCKLDQKPWRSCRSPARFRKLKSTRHRLRVRAIDAAGNVDPTPAARTFRVRR